MDLNNPLIGSQEMRKFFWILASGILLMALLGASTLLAASKKHASARTFTSQWNIYRLSLNVSRHAAILDFGEEACLRFAKQQRASKQWIYAYESSLDQDPETGKFSTEKAEGQDRLMRYFGDQQAQIVIDWLKMDDKSTLEKKFNALDAEVLGGGGSNRKAAKIGKTVSYTIGGFPAMGANYSINGGKSGYIGIWLVRAEKYHRWYAITFTYTKGLETPDNAFGQVKKSIVFLKP